jgi:hypothetical protein
LPVSLLVERSRFAAEGIIVCTTLITFNIGGALRSIVMNINDQTRFNQSYQAYLNELTLQGKSPKTIDMYSRCIRQGIAGA